jgi:hypothetical protein
MSIQNRHVQSADRRPRLVPFQTGGEVTQSLAQMVGSDAGGDAPQGVRTGRGTAEPRLPRSRGAVLLPRVQAAQARPNPHPTGFEQNRGGDALLREAVDGLAIPDQASEDETIPFDRAAAATRSPRVPRAVAGFPDSPERFAGYALPTLWGQTPDAASRPDSGQGTVTRAVPPGRSGSWIYHIGEIGERRCPEETAESTRVVRGANGGYARRPTD